MLWWANMYEAGRHLRRHKERAKRTCELVAHGVYRCVMRTRVAKCGSFARRTCTLGTLQRRRRVTWHR